MSARAKLEVRGERRHGVSVRQLSLIGPKRLPSILLPARPPRQPDTTCYNHPQHFGDSNCGELRETIVDNTSQCHLKILIDCTPLLLTNFISNFARADMRSTYDIIPDTPPSASCTVSPSTIFGACSALLVNDELQPLFEFQEGVIWDGERRDPSASSTSSGARVALQGAGSWQQRLNAAPSLGCSATSPSNLSECSTISAEDLQSDERAGCSVRIAQRRVWPNCVLCGHV